MGWGELGNRTVARIGNRVPVGSKMTVIADCLIMRMTEQREEVVLPGTMSREQGKPHQMNASWHK